MAKLFEIVEPEGSSDKEKQKSVLNKLRTRNPGFELGVGQGLKVQFDHERYAHKVEHLIATESELSRYSCLANPLPNRKRELFIKRIY